MIYRPGGSHYIQVGFKWAFLVMLIGKSRAHMAHGKCDAVVEIGANIRVFLLQNVGHI